MGQRDFLAVLMVAGALAAWQGSAWAQATAGPRGGTSRGTSAAQGSTPAKGQKATASGRAADTFMNEAAQGGLAEVELGKLASEKASNPDVKAFGEHMVQDHSKANAELKTLAESRGMTVPSDVGSKNAALKKKLEGLSGAAFDKAYVTEMVKDHKHDVAAFEKHARAGHDPEVSSFASKTLPTLKEHLSRIEEISKSMKHTPTSKSASRKM